MRGNRNWLLVLFFLSFLLLSTLNSPAKAFRVIDSAMCKEIDWNTLDCKERTNEFSINDEWAYFLLKANFEKLDVDAKIELKIYDPDGYESSHIYGPMLMDPAKSIPWPIGEWMLGETVMWIGIGIRKALTEDGVVPSGINPTDVRVSVENLRLKSTSSQTLNFNPRGQPLYYVSIHENKMPASENPGEYKVDFMMNNMVVITQRFWIGQKPTPPPTTPALTTTTPPATKTEEQPSAGISSFAILLTIAIIVLIYMKKIKKSPIKSSNKTEQDCHSEIQGMATKAEIPEPPG